VVGHEYIAGAVSNLVLCPLPEFVKLNPVIHTGVRVQTYFGRDLGYRGIKPEWKKSASWGLICNRYYHEESCYRSSVVGIVDCLSLVNWVLKLRLAVRSGRGVMFWKLGSLDGVVSLFFITSAIV
jgi:hypothetical protein